MTALAIATYLGLGLITSALSGICIGISGKHFTLIDTFLCIVIWPFVVVTIIYHNVRLSKKTKR